MNDTELLDAVEDMRAAQKTYFKTRDYNNLIAAKDAERKVDNLVKQRRQQAEDEAKAQAEKLQGKLF